MKRTVVSFANSLLAEAITQMLNDSSEFEPFRLAVSRRHNNTVSQCEMMAAEMLIAEVSYAGGTTVDARMAEVKELRKRLPNCKIVLLCDENSTPDIAHEVMLAKKDGRIDAFFYSSVTSRYLLAALTAL